MGPGPAGYNSGKVHRSTDGGAAWTTILTANERWEQSFVAAHPYRPGVVYAGGVEDPYFDHYVSSGLYRSTDGGGTWTVVAGAVPFKQLTNVAFDPDDCNVLYVGTSGGGVFRVIDDCSR